MLITLKQHHNDSICFLKVLACLYCSPDQSQELSVAFEYWQKMNWPTHQNITLLLDDASVNWCPDTRFENKINTEIYNRAANIINLWAAAHISILHTDFHTPTLKHTPHKIYILTHNNILCLGNRLHMVGSGCGPEDCLLMRHETCLFQPGHSLRLTGPNAPGSLSKETGSLLIIMSWMHPT